MKKVQNPLCYFILTTALILSTHTSFAQAAKDSKLSLYVHALYGFSIETSSQQNYKGQFGGVAGLGYNINNSMPVGSIGYSSLASKKSGTGSVSYIPLKLGLRQMLPLQKTTLFGQGDVGVAFLGPNNINVSGNTSSFAFDLGVGAKIGQSIETAVVWDNYKETGNYGWSSWITLHLGWAMKF